jgi:hypothetical protein
MMLLPSAGSPSQILNSAVSVLFWQVVAQRVLSQSAGVLQVLPSAQRGQPEVTPPQFRSLSS